MEFFVKKIFEGKPDELVHNQFKKYSRGDFRDKAMIVCKKTAKGYNISTTNEYANEFVRYFSEKLGDERVAVTGVIVSTRDLTGEIDFKNKKQFMGVKQYIMEGEMSGNEMITLCDKLPKAFFGLSFTAFDTVLKIKAKAPKSAKPSTKTGEKPKVDFCKIKTKDEEFVKSLIFDEGIEGFKKVEISNDFLIDEIYVSDEVKKEADGDFAVIKDMARRRGKVVRRVIVDEGEEVSNEFELDG